MPDPHWDALTVRGVDISAAQRADTCTIPADLCSSVYFDLLFLRTATLIEEDVDPVEIVVRLDINIKSYMPTRGLLIMPTRRRRLRKKTLINGVPLVTDGSVDINS